MRSQIEPAFALLHKNCEIRGFPTSFFRFRLLHLQFIFSSFRFSHSHLFFLLFSLPSFICRTHFLSLSFFLSLVLFSLFPNRFAIVFHVYFSISPNFPLDLWSFYGTRVITRINLPLSIHGHSMGGFEKDPIQDGGGLGRERRNGSDIFDRLTNSFHLAKDATSACIYIAGSVRCAAR